LGRAKERLAYNHLRDGRAEEGDRAVRAAVALFLPLEAKFPDVAEYGRRLGRAYDLFGVVGLVSGRYREYESHWDQATEVLSRTLKRHPDDLEAKSQLAVVYSNAGESLEARDDQKGAASNRSRAIELSRQ